jgi:molecular chaperone GrpE
MSRKMSNNDTEDLEVEGKNPELLEHPAYEELLKKLDECEKKSDQHWERILRMQADAENILRRQERDLANAHKYALEKFIGELLPIIDSLELALTRTPERSKQEAQAVIDGVELTLKMFLNALDKFGVKQVNPISQPFNPEFEQAISVQLDETVKPGTVLSVLQKGYTLNNRLIRPALVVVSKEKE